MCAFVTAMPTRTHTNTQCALGEGFRNRNARKGREEEKRTQLTEERHATKSNLEKKRETTGGDDGGGKLHLRWRRHRRDRDEDTGEHK